MTRFEGPNNCDILICNRCHGKSKIGVVFISDTSVVDLIHLDNGADICRTCINEILSKMVRNDITLPFAQDIVAERLRTDPLFKDRYDQKASKEYPKRVKASRVSYYVSIGHSLNGALDKVGMSKEEYEKYRERGL